MRQFTGMTAPLTLTVSEVTDAADDADKGTETEKHYYVTDSHGNVVQLTDESGKIVKTSYCKIWR